MNKQERIKIPRQKMHEQPADVRVTNFSEVPFGYTEEAVKAEASRCIQCGANAPCIKGCPVGINIPAFMAETEKGNFRAALQIIKESNLLPAICGRVCPQESQCQENCTVGKLLKNQEEAVSIGFVERFLGDYGLTIEEELQVLPATGKKVVIVGSGPAGLTTAGELAKLGHEVHIMEALHSPGGVLAYGIPEFRLPKSIVAREVEKLEQLGVKFHYSTIAGRTKTIKQLQTEFDAIFVGSGAGLPVFLNIPGENLLGVYTANEYLTRVNLMKAFKEESRTPIIKGRKVIVVGGGNVAMDAARTARRLGAAVTLVYRRTEAEMPARNEEIHHAKEEGVELCLLHNPVAIHADQDGWVKSMEVLRMELGEPDTSGRRRPLEVKGSEYHLACDVVIVAIGNNPNPLIPEVMPDLKVNKWHGIEVNEETLETSVTGVFAGGDIVLGAATVIKAMEHGKRAAVAIDAYLKK